MDFNDIYEIEDETERIKKTYEIFNEDKAIDCKNRNNISDNQSDLAKMQNDLEDLL